MPHKKQWFLLLFVFVITGVGVWTVRTISNRQVLAWVMVVPHDGAVVSGGLTAFENMLANSKVSGVFYQESASNYLLPFQASLQPELLSELQAKNDALIWHNVNPDSLFLRSWTAAYARMVLALPQQVKDSLNLVSELYMRNRTLAVIAKEARRDSLLQAFGSNMDAFTNGKYTELRKRFARQLLNASNKQMAKKPGKHWVFVIDVELYPYVRDAFKNTERYRFEE